MSTNNHTAITTGAAANASVINSPLGQLDAAIGNLTTIHADLTHTSVAAAIGTTDPGTTATTISGALAEVKAQATALGGGATVTAARLIEWTEGGDYELTSVAYDTDGVATGGTVKWPDGSAGVFTTVTKNATYFAIDKYTVTHATAGKTVTQDTVTRDANGQVTAKPALTVA